jgi:hypothetical protein
MGPEVRHTIATLTRLRREVSEDRAAHAYAVSVDPAKLEPELVRIRRIAPEVEAGFGAFDAHLEAAIETLQAE